MTRKDGATMCTQRDGPGTAPPAHLLQYVGFLLNRSAAQIRERFTRALEPLGITPKHYGVLALLDLAGPLSQHEIGDRVWYDRTTMVSIVDDLERRSLARRKAFPGDRRAYAVCLTPKGRALRARAKRVAIRVNQQFLSVLKPRERRQLQTLLKRLVLQSGAPTHSRPATAHKETL